MSNFGHGISVVEFGVNVDAGDSGDTKINNIVSGYILYCVARSKSQSTDPQNKEASNYEANFGNILASGTAGYGWDYIFKSGAGAVAEVSERIFNWFDPSHTLRIYSSLGGANNGPCRMNIEFLDSNETPIFVIKVVEVGTYTISVKYGTNMNSLVSAPAGPRQTDFNGYLVFDEVGAHFFNYKPSDSWSDGSQYKNFSFSCDISRIKKVKISALSKADRALYNYDGVTNSLYINPIGFDWKSLVQKPPNNG
ncbi:hypothetical protein [Francisella philomiragia]|uniref:hypothetical protein n=1 Tax=Francisella philomiragia TaxID=28110 RepID=UPI00224491BF|nr:hypothetical protein [Francisella philomiragia]